MSTKTAEEAAREFATDNSEHFRFVANLDRSEIKEIIEVAYLAGREAERKSEKVLGERWVVTFNNFEDKTSVFPNVLEVAKGWAWQVALKIREMPCSFTLEQREKIARCESAGYRAVKVKLVEVEE